MYSSIHQEVEIRTSTDRIFEAMMDTQKRSEFTGAPAQVSREAGGAFSAHGGVITGWNLELVPNRRIVQSWRFGNWTEGVHSIVRIELTPDGDSTRLALDHTGIPATDQGHLESGWIAQYWDKLKKYLE